MPDPIKYESENSLWDAVKRGVKMALPVVTGNPYQFRPEPGTPGWNDVLSRTAGWIADKSPWKLSTPFEAGETLDPPWQEWHPELAGSTYVGPDGQLTADPGRMGMEESMRLLPWEASGYGDTPNILSGDKRSQEQNPWWMTAVEAIEEPWMAGTSRIRKTLDDAKTSAAKGGYLEQVIAGNPYSPHDPTFNILDFFKTEELTDYPDSLPYAEAVEKGIIDVNASKQEQYRQWKEGQPAVQQIGAEIIPEMVFPVAGLRHVPKAFGKVADVFSDTTVRAWDDFISSVPKWEWNQIPKIEFPAASLASPVTGLGPGGFAPKLKVGGKLARNVDPAGKAIKDDYGKRLTDAIEKYDYERQMNQREAREDFAAVILKILDDTAAFSKKPIPPHPNPRDLTYENITDIKDRYDYEGLHKVYMSYAKAKTDKTRNANFVKLHETAQRILREVLDKNFKVTPTSIYAKYVEPEATASTPIISEVTGGGAKGTPVEIANEAKLLDEAVNDKPAGTGSNLVVTDDVAAITPKINKIDPDAGSDTSISKATTDQKDVVSDTRHAEVGDAAGEAFKYADDVAVLGGSTEIEGVSGFVPNPHTDWAAFVDFWTPKSGAEKQVIEDVMGVTPDDVALTTRTEISLDNLKEVMMNLRGDEHPAAVKAVEEAYDTLEALEVVRIQSWFKESEYAVDDAVRVLNDIGYNDSAKIVANIINGEVTDPATREAIQFFQRRVEETINARYPIAGDQANISTSSLARRNSKTPSLGSQIPPRITDGEMHEIITTHSTHHEFILINSKYGYPVKVYLPRTTDNDIYLSQIMVDPNQRVLHTTSEIRHAIQAMFDFYGKVNMPTLLRRNPELSLAFRDRAAEEWSKISTAVSAEKELKRAFNDNGRIRSRKQKSFSKLMKRRLSTAHEVMRRDLQDWISTEAPTFKGLKEYNAEVRRFEEELRQMIAEFKRPSRAKFKQIKDPIIDLPADAQVVPLLDVPIARTPITPGTVFSHHNFSEVVAKALAQDDFKVATTEEIKAMTPDESLAYTEAMSLYYGITKPVLNTAPDVLAAKEAAMRATGGTGNTDNIVAQYWTAPEVQKLITASHSGNITDVQRSVANILTSIRNGDFKVLEDAEAASEIVEKLDGSAGGGGLYPPSNRALFGYDEQPPAAYTDETSVVGLLRLMKRWGEEFVADELAQGNNITSNINWHTQRITGYQLTGEETFEILAANLPGIQPYVQENIKTMFFKMHELFENTEAYSKMGGRFGPYFRRNEGHIYFEEHVNSLAFLQTQADIMSAYPKRKITVRKSYATGQPRVLDSNQAVQMELDALQEAVINNQAKVTGKSVEDIIASGNTDYDKILASNQLLIDHYDNVLRTLADDGTISWDEYATMRRIHPHYVPTQLENLIAQARDITKRDVTNTLSGDLQTREMAQRAADPRRILHELDPNWAPEDAIDMQAPLSNVGSYTEWLLKKSARNKVLRTYIDNVVGDPSNALHKGGAITFEGVTRSAKSHDELLKGMNVKHIINLPLRDGQIDQTLVSRIRDSMPNESREGASTVFIKRNGEVEAYILPGQHAHILGSIMLGRGASMGRPGEVFDTLTNVPAKAVYVGFNPAFIHAELGLNMFTAMFRANPLRVLGYSLQEVFWNSWMRAARNTTSVIDQETLKAGGNITLSQHMGRSELSRAERQAGKSKKMRYEGNSFINAMMRKDPSLKKKQGFLGQLPDGYRISISANDWDTFRRHPMAMLFRFWGNYRNALEQAPRLAATRAAAKRKTRDVTTGKKELRYGLFETYTDSQGVQRYKIENSRRVPIVDEQGQAMLDYVALATERRRSTLDFSRGGKIFKLINPFFAFANVAAQGALQIPLRNIQHGFRESRQLRGGIGGAIRGGMGVAGGPQMSLIYLAWAAQIGAFQWNKQFPEYWDVPIWDRFGPVIMLDSDPDDINPDTGRPYPRYITLPFPERQLSLFFAPAQYLIEAMYDGMDGVTDTPRSTWDEVTDHVLQQSSPFSFTDTIPGDIKQFVPGVITRLAADLFFNNKTFTGAPIIPEYMKNWNREDQINEHTTDTAIATSNLITKIIPDWATKGGPSPLQVQYIMDQTGAFKEVITIADWMAMSEELGVKPSSVRHAEEVMSLIYAMPDPESRVTAMNTYLNSELDSVQQRNEVEIVVKQAMQGSPNDDDKFGSAEDWPLIGSFMRRSYHARGAVSRKWTARERASEELGIDIGDNQHKLMSSRIQEANYKKDTEYDKIQAEFDEHQSTRLFRDRKSMADMAALNIRLSIMDDDDLDGFVRSEDKQQALGELYRKHISLWGDTRENRIEMHISHYHSVIGEEYLDGSQNVQSLFNGRDEVRDSIIANYGMEEWEAVNSRMMSKMTSLERSYTLDRQNIISPFYQQTRDYVLNSMRGSDLTSANLANAYEQYEEGNTVEQSIMMTQNPNIDKVVSQINGHINSLRENVRASDPDLDMTLVRWKYTEAPRTQQGYELLQDLQQKEAIWGAKKQSEANDPFNNLSKDFSMSPML